MTASIHFHPGAGELAGFTVMLEPIDNPNCEPRVAVHIFAGAETPHALIGDRAIEKMRDKWQRDHMRKTKWRVLSVHGNG